MLKSSWGAGAHRPWRLNPVGTDLCPCRQQGSCRKHTAGVACQASAVRKGANCGRLLSCGKSCREWTGITGGMRCWAQCCYRLGHTVAHAGYRSPARVELQALPPDAAPGLLHAVRDRHDLHKAAVSSSDGEAEPWPCCFDGALTWQGPMR